MKLLELIKKCFTKDLVLVDSSKEFEDVLMLSINISGHSTVHQDVLRRN